MNISLITFHCALSNGAALQTLALCRILEHIGHSVEIVDYRPENIANPPDWRNTRFHGFHPAHLESWLTRKKFASFRSRFMPLTRKIYRTFKELKSDPPDADIFICGSDQIWNPEITNGSLDPAYFLDFAPTNKRRIAYAASLGAACLPSGCLDLFKQLISRMDFISCREAEASSFVEDTTGRKITTTLDPALLATDWEKWVPEKRPPKHPYVFAFTLQQNNDILMAIAAGSDEMDCSARIAGGPWKWWTLPGHPAYPGPDEWVRLFRHATAVLTDSFHGTVFSILHRRNFIVFPLAGKMSGRNTRITRLLNSLGLQDRLVSPSDPETIRRILREPIDWTTVEQQLAEMRAASFQYLLRALTSPAPQP